MFKELIQQSQEGVASINDAGAIWLACSIKVFEPVPQHVNDFFKHFPSPISMPYYL